MTQKMPVFSSRIVDGIRIHCATVGVATSDPPLVLIHGLSDSHKTWQPIVQQLSQHRQVIMPDLPGHGYSERPDSSYELAWYSHMMARWLEDSELKSVDICGHSLGGGIAQMMLLECPERIRRIALAASGGLGREISVALRLASVPYVVEHLGQPFMKLGTRIALTLARDGRAQHDIAFVAAMNQQRGSARAFSRTVRDLMDWRGQRHGFQKRGAEIASLPPIRLFWGERDAIIPIAHAEEFKRNFSGVELIAFAGCGHYFHFQEPAAFARSLIEFFDAPSLASCVLGIAPYFNRDHTTRKTLREGHEAFPQVVDR